MLRRLLLATTAVAIIGALAVPAKAQTTLRLVSKDLLTTNPDGTADKALGIGSLAGAAVDFVIIALVVYLIGKSLLKPAPAPPAPPTKTCNDCTSSIPVAAKKCMHCGSAV